MFIAEGKKKTSRTSQTLCGCEVRREIIFEGGAINISLLSERIQGDQGLVTRARVPVAAGVG